MDKVTNGASTGVMASDMNRLRCETDGVITCVLTAGLVVAAVFWDDLVNAMVMLAVPENQWMSIEDTARRKQQEHCNGCNTSVAEGD